ncbi:MAG TPA: hypothetical protein VLD63_14845 [Anaerolineales bacterium]|nr:hypothetical protein [Anaerolineales bacterium]
MHLDDATLNEFLDRRLTRGSDRQARDHLKSCAACRTRLAALEDLTASLQALPEVRLTRDLVHPVLARVRRRSAPRLLTWMTALEALAGASLIATIWPRLEADLATVAALLVPPTLVPWAETLVGSWDSNWPQWLADIRVLQSAADMWLRSLTAGSAMSWPFVLTVGAAALVLGALGNGVLLRFPARRA